jgi:hypothetical protein
MDIIRLFQSLEDCFGDIPDPRVVGRCGHLLVDIIMVAVYGAGGDSLGERVCP